MLSDFQDFSQKNFVIGLILFVFINSSFGNTDKGTCTFVLRKTHGIYTQECNGTHVPLFGITKAATRLDIKYGCTVQLECDDDSWLFNPSQFDFKKINSEPCYEPHTYYFPECKNIGNTDENTCRYILRETHGNYTLKCNGTHIPFNGTHIPFNGTHVPLFSIMKGVTGLDLKDGCAVSLMCDNDCFIFNEHGFHHVTKVSLQCYGLFWHYFPECKKKCPRLRTTGLHVNLKCIYNGKPHPCKSPLISGTEVRISCMKYYQQEHPVSYDRVYCQENGKWSNPLFKCIQVCGRKFNISNLSKTTFLSSELLEVVNSPWYAVIQNPFLSNGSFTSGIIISDRVVMGFGNPLRFSELRISSTEIVVGENPREICYGNASEHMETYSVKDVKSRPGGVNQILLFILHESIHISERILPVCINYGSETSSFPFNNGYVASIFLSEYTRKFGVLNVKLRIPRNSKEDEILGILTSPYNATNANYPDDQIVGQGLTFLHPSSNLHYLQGVLTQFWLRGSTSTINQTISDVLFVNTYFHRNWIKKILDEVEYESVGIVLECGQISATHIPQIHSGAKVSFGTSPWHVALYRTKNKKRELICGGTIISKQVILSAAHCFFGSSIPTTIDTKSYEIVVAKTTRDYNRKDNDFQKLYKIRNVICPDTYNGPSTFFTSDIALVVLQENIEFNAAIRPICTEFTREDDFPLKNGYKGKIVGWGRTEYREVSDTLLAANVSFIDLPTCIKSLPTDSWDSITIDKFCAKNENGFVVDQGDSGGGLVFLHPDFHQYYLRGIVSTKLVHNSPVSIFTDVKFHNEWIQKNLKSI